MDEFKTAEQVREYILSYRADADDELIGTQVSPCFSLSWKRDHWLIKENYKKVGTVEPKMLPKNFDMRSRNFLEDVLAILRKGGLKGLTSYLKALKRGEDV